MEGFRGVDRRPKTYGKKKTARPYVSSIFDQPSPKTYRYIVSGQDILEDPSSTELETQCLPSEALHVHPEDEPSGQTESTCSRHRPTHHSRNTETILEEAFTSLHIVRQREDDSNQGPESPILRTRSPNVQTTASHHLEVNVKPTHQCRARSHVVLPSLRKKDVSTTGILKSTHRKVEKLNPKVVDLHSSLQPDNSREWLATRKSATAVDSRRGTRQSAQHRENNDPYSFTRPLLDLANDSLSRRAPVQFQAWANELQGLFELKKIAEASYGEVYRLKLIDRSTLLGASTTDESVLKVIPLKPQVVFKSRKRQAEQMSAVEDVFMEVQTLMRMSVIPGFTNFRDIRVMEGRFPSQFVKAWKDYIQDGGKSYLPDPGNIRSYPKSQLWAVIEMENAGVDLEKFPLQNFVQTWDIFWSVAMALAKGEDLARFEHRDLHLGNICVQERDKKQHQSHRSVGHSNLNITIIDYTLSRAEIESKIVDDAETRTAYLDLERDLALFAGSGEYQYDVYRYMRSALYYDDPLVRMEDDSLLPNSRGWYCYKPITNVLWLHFMLVALKDRLHAVVSKAVDEADESIDQEPQLKRLNAMYEQRLRKLEEALDPRRRHPENWWTARGVVDYALKKAWLTEQDIIECDLD